MFLPQNCFILHKLVPNKKKNIENFCCFNYFSRYNDLSYYDFIYYIEIPIGFCVN